MMQDHRGANLEALCDLRSLKHVLDGESHLVSGGKNCHHTALRARWKLVAMRGWIVVRWMLWDVT